MINIWGVDFGVLYPATLYTLPALLALLVYAYLRRNRGKRLEVGSTILLKLLTRRPRARKKFIPPFRFFFELLLLLLLLAGAAGLYKRSTSNRVAVLIDNSLSMAAVPRGDTAAQSLLTLALADAQSVVGSLASDSLVNVYVTSPLLTSVSNGYVSPTSAEQALKQITIKYFEDNLSAAIEKLGAEPGVEELIVFTDKRSTDSKRSSITSLGLDQRLKIHSMNSSDRKNSFQNIALSHLQLKANATGGRESLQVGVSAYTLSQVKVRVFLDEVTSLEAGQAHYSSIGQKNLSIAGRAEGEANFENITSITGAYRVRIEEDAEGGAERHDAIKEDNIGWVAKSGKRESLTLVSDFTPEELGLQKLPHVKFNHSKPAAYSSDAAKNPPSQSAIIFHRFAPAKLPKANSLFILPPSESGLFQLGGESSSVVITRWAADHPMINYLNLPALNLQKAAPIEVPPWAKDIISTNIGSVAVAGESGNYRYAALGFEILPFEGKHAAVASILTLNLIKWLSEISADTTYQLTYSTAALAESTQKLRYLDGEELYTRNQNSKEKVERVSLPRPGLIQILDSSATLNFIAVNFIDADESNIVEPRTVSTTLSHSESAQQNEDVLTLTKLLALIALILVMADIIVLTRGLGLRRELR